MVPPFGCGEQLGFDDVYVFGSGNSRAMSASQTMLIRRRVFSTVPSRKACWRLPTLESPTSCARVRALRMSWFHWLGAEAARLRGAGVSFRGLCIVFHRCGQGSLTHSGHGGFKGAIVLMETDASWARSKASFNAGSRSNKRFLSSS